MNKEYKVYYGGTPATQEQLDAIEEIVVEQEVGIQWVARIRIPVCIAADGSWDGEDDPAFEEFARVRIEARIGEGDFVPLIDGRIVSQMPDYNASPGLSSVTIVVHDDTNLLHRETGSEPFSGQTDSEIARSILGTAELGGSVNVDDAVAGSDTDAVANRHGTRMQMLREIVARNPSFYVYVLPGSIPGTSDGYFKRLPTVPDLPEMYLSGPDQNISSFRISRNSGRAASVEGAHLSLSDKAVTTARADHGSAAPPTGETATGGGISEVRLIRLPPGIGDHTDITEAAEGTAENAAITLSAEGSVLPMCYSAVLSPYRMVSISVSDSRYSAHYVIFKVVHTLGISEYTQSFSVRGNSVSPEAPASASLPAAAAVLSVSFNAQVDIF